MKKLLISFLLFYLFFSGSASSLSRNKEQYVSRKIQQMAEMLQLHTLPGKDTLMVVPSLVPNKDVIFAYNGKGELEHLGFSLFSKEVKDMLDRKICNFLERILLELLLQGDREGICFKLKEYHMQMYMDGVDYMQKNLWTLSHLLKNMEMPVNFVFKHEAGKASALWSFGTHSLQLDFPLYRELIEGTDKKESDMELYDRIQGVSFMIIDCEDEKVNVELLQEKNGVYVLPGTKFEIKELSSDRYYIKHDNGFELIFHQNYPEYSLNNLFFSCTRSKDVTLHLKHRQYGRFTPEISIPLVNFLDFMKKDFILNCHTGYDKRGNLQTLVVMNHKNLNFVHLLRVSVSKEKLFEPGLVLEGDFYSNIPQHYIKNLLK